MTEPLKNVAEAAVWLGISKDSLADMVSGRKVPFTFVGRHVRFAQHHLDAIVTAGEQQPIVNRTLTLATPAAPPPTKPAAPPRTPPPPPAPASPPPPSGPRSPISPRRSRMIPDQQPTSADAA